MGPMWVPHGLQLGLLSSQACSKDFILGGGSEHAKGAPLGGAWLQGEGFPRPREARKNLMFH